MNGMMILHNTGSSSVSSFYLRDLRGMVTRIFPQRMPQRFPLLTQREGMKNVDYLSHLEHRCLPACLAG